MELHSKPNFGDSAQALVSAINTLISPVGDEGSGNATGVGADLGFWLDNNAVESARRLFKQNYSDNFFLRPSLGFAVTNVGPSVTYDGHSDSDPLPRTARITMGLTAGIQIKHPDGLPWRMVTLNVAAEADDELVKREDYREYSYQFPPGDINPLRDVLLSQSNSRLMQKKAFELSVLDMLFVRGGSHSYDGNYPLIIRYSGWGFSVRGALRLASHATAFNDLTWLVRHVDIQYHEAKEDAGSGDRYDNDYNPRDGTQYKGITLTYIR